MDLTEKGDDLNLESDTEVLDVQDVQDEDLTGEGDDLDLESDVRNVQDEHEKELEAATLRKNKKYGKTKDQRILDEMRKKHTHANATKGKSRKQYSLADKAAVIRAFEGGMRKCDIFKNFGIAKSTLHAWVSSPSQKSGKEAAKAQKNKILKAIHNGTDQTRKKQRSSKYKDLEECLWAWYLGMRTEHPDVPITGLTIRMKAEALAVMLNMKNFEEAWNASEGFLYRFKLKYKIRSRRICGEVHSAEETAADDWLSTTFKSIKERYSVQCTCLFSRFAINVNLQSDNCD